MGELEHEYQLEVIERQAARITELEEALALAFAYVERVHGTIASAMGHENTVVRPDLDKIRAVLRFH